MITSLQTLWPRGLAAAAQKALSQRAFVLILLRLDSMTDRQLKKKSGKRIRHFEKDRQLLPHSILIIVGRRRLVGVT